MSPKQPVSSTFVHWLQFWFMHFPTAGLGTDAAFNVMNSLKRGPGQLKMLLLEKEKSSFLESSPFSSLLLHLYPLTHHLLKNFKLYMNTSKDFELKLARDVGPSYHLHKVYIARAHVLGIPLMECPHVKCNAQLCVWIISLKVQSSLGCIRDVYHRIYNTSKQWNLPIDLLCFLRAFKDDK